MPRTGIRTLDPLNWTWSSDASSWVEGSNPIAGEIFWTKFIVFSTFLIQKWLESELFKQTNDKVDLETLEQPFYGRNAFRASLIA